MANCLVQLFSRVGVPNEIVTDQYTNFLSLLLKQVYSLLGIKGIKTTPYHPQTDGLVEHFNRTLKTMLHRFISQSGKDWDEWLPYLLFAYREVPQASTGFSPFELLFGRQVRGPLDLLKELWEGPEDNKQSVALYVIQMHERLEQMSALAQQNMESAQKKQKTWYDKKARERSFMPGQKVLLLLPTDDSKLLAKWHGPYEIIRKVGDVTYEVGMPDRGKKKQNFHVNLLKEYHSREQVATQLFVRTVTEEEEPEEQFFPVKSTTATIDLSHLEKDQRGQVTELLDSNLFTEKPGRTTAVEHDIILQPNATPLRKSYCIPERLVSVLREELDVMLSLGVIEPSSSDWCSPVVLVPKRDHTIRFCIDFRQVNALSKVDPYPMPRIDDLVERLGKAKYISTIDLSRGYWQVPLSERAKEVKCALRRREVSYLGYIIGNGVVRPQVEKIEAISSCTPPTTKKKVRSFLGLVGWYRRFIPNFSERSSVLSDLTRSAAPIRVVWTEQCEAMFQDLKGAVCSDSVLLSPDFNRPFIVQTDASCIHVHIRNLLDFSLKVQK